MGVQLSTAVEIEDESWLEVIEQAALAALTHLAPSSDAEVSVLIGDDALVHELNRRWRGTDAPTDVLSFAMTETDADEPQYEPVGEPHLLGDVVISLPRAKAQATEYGHSIQRELAFLVIHGMLHLLGYDHENDIERRQMRDCEEAILVELGWER